MSWLSLALTLCLAGPALAVDGVLEINQTCAVQTGCFAGDTPGYPITINASGSYRLTSNLSSVGLDLDGLFLGNARITLDFNGFTLLGPSAGTGIGNGIAGAGTNGSAAGFATIKNGVIRGYRSRGIALSGAEGVRIEDMTIHFNNAGGAEVGDEARVLRNGFSDNGSTLATGHGLVTGARALISQNVVNSSGGAGIVSGIGSTVSGNTSSENGNDGINADDGSIISGNVVHANGGNGITARTDSTITGNTASENTNTGIVAQADCSISNNSASGNGNSGIQGGLGSLVVSNTANQNTNAGIIAGSGSMVQGNNGYFNGTFGASFPVFITGGVYRENVFMSNGNGGVTGGGTNLGDNYCRGTGVVSSSCP